MKRVRLLADARREFNREIVYYEAERQGLGKRFPSAELPKQSFSRLATLPVMASLARTGHAES